MFSSNLLDNYLNTKTLGRIVKYKPKTFSTNNDAKQYINDNNYHGSLFVTDSQLKGRGRRDNIWESSQNKSLTFSLILYPKINFRSIGLLPLLAGISAVKGIQKSTSIQSGLKWPNDIILDQKKIGGILIESKQTKHGFGIIIGMGLNINEKVSDIPNYIINKTSSLAIFTGKSFCREKILANILNEFEYLLDNCLNSIISIWENSCIHMNSHISFHSEDELHKGIFKGISSEGYALIDINGNFKTFPSGMIIL